MSRRLLAAVTCAAALLTAAPAALAGMIAVVPAGDFVEDLTGALSTTFVPDTPGLYDLEWHVHPAGAACAPTAGADDGILIRARTREPLRAAGEHWRIWTTFRDSGSYLVCAWATTIDGVQTIAGETTLTVRPPREALYVNAPSTVTAGRPFELKAAAVGEAPRMVFVTLNASSVPCARSYMADQALTRPIYAGWLQGTYGETRPVTILRPGVYRLCGWLGEHARDPAPERTTQQLIRVASREPRRRPPRRSTSR